MVLGKSGDNLCPVKALVGYLRKRVEPRPLVYSEEQPSFDEARLCILCEGDGEAGL